ncbi:DUF3152 domain-containing protein [Streptomyces sp. NPDC087440]|uniref:DUF3152 domain-containing protein n=1 Tax=Streptomyces sp. NPDC087440 TaxID=3365790 RepID=UPI003812D669
MGAGSGAVTDTGSGRYGDWVGAPQTQPQTRPQPQPQPPAGIGVGARIPAQRRPGQRAPGPRRDFVEAFEEPQPQPRTAGPRDPYDAVTDWGDAEALHAGADDSDGTAPRSGRWLARTVIGVSAAAVTAALAVMVTGPGSSSGPKDKAAGAGVVDRDGADDPSRDKDRTAPQGNELKKAPATGLSYEQRMAQKLPMAADQRGPNAFDTVPGEAAAPRKGAKHFRYRVDVEKDLGLDGKFFADAVQRTLNDKRSWAGDGRMSFERVSTEKADFVVTLASPVTTDIWCEKSGLETLSRNVSCDSARTERVMINAFRWAGGSETFGDALLFPYRQMLINHEVGHRLGHNHEICSQDGALAPVMMQQTKTLETGDKKCRPNAWVHPES